MSGFGWTDDEKRIALEMYEAGAAMSETAKKLGRSTRSVQRKIDRECAKDGFRSQRRERQRIERDRIESARIEREPTIKKDTRAAIGCETHKSSRPGVDLLVERDKRLSEPRSLTALLLGDPPPSRSALAKKQGGS